MLLVEKVSNFLDYRIEAVVTTPLSDKKSLTKYVDKVTDELEDMKETVVKIHRKYLDKFEVRSKVSIGWFKPDSNFFKSTIHPEFYKHYLKMILKVKIRNCIRRLLYRLVNNPSGQKM